MCEWDPQAEMIFAHGLLLPLAEFCYNQARHYLTLHSPYRWHFNIYTLFIRLCFHVIFRLTSLDTRMIQSLGKDWEAFPKSYAVKAHASLVAILILSLGIGCLACSNLLSDYIVLILLWIDLCQALCVVLLQRSIYTRVFCVVSGENVDGFVAFVAGRTSGAIPVQILWLILSLASVPFKAKYFSCILAACALMVICVYSVDWQERSLIKKSALPVALWKMDALSLIDTNRRAGYYPMALALNGFVQCAIVNLFMPRVLGEIIQDAQTVDLIRFGIVGFLTVSTITFPLVLKRFRFRHGPHALGALFSALCLLWADHLAYGHVKYAVLPGIILLSSCLLCLCCYLAPNTHRNASLCAKAYGDPSISYSLGSLLCLVNGCVVILVEILAHFHD